MDTYRQKNYAPGKSQDDPEATAQYLGQLEEMVATSRSHASVLFWSIGKNPFMERTSSCRMTG